MHTFIIAEAGANHNRDIGNAYKLIEAAKDAGADAVKFQTYSSETLYSKNTPSFAGYEDINQLIKNIELPREWQQKLKHYCDKVGIEFMSTPFDEQAIKELVDIGVKRIKVAGFESTDLRFLTKVFSTGLPVILSSGINSNRESRRNVIRIYESSPCQDLTLLHCNNAYPTPVEDTNLLTIPKIKEELNIKVGLSDHTESTLTPSLAVMLGAEVIEKHFTLDKKMPGPDHPFALEPHELKEMVKNIRFAEKTLSVRNGDYTSSELKFKNAGRSIVASTNLVKGEVLTEKNITTKRPFLEGNIHASEYYNYLGKTVNVNVEEDMALKFEDIF